MELQDIYNLIEANLDNEINHMSGKNGKMKRIKLPIPKEYGGGFVTGYGYEETVRNLISRVKNQIKMEVKGPLFSDCWQKWIELKAGQRKAESTIENYKWIFNSYLSPFFDKKHIDEISSDDIQLYFNSIMDKSESISIQSKAILSGIFDRAIRLGDVQRNPMTFKYERSHKKGSKVVLQDKDLIEAINQIDLLRDLEDGRGYLYFCLLCFTSLRRGEILGLKWTDICFETSTIYVRNNVTFPNGQNNPVIREPKDGSYGEIHLQSELAKRIKPYMSKGFVLPYSKKDSDRPMTKSMFVKMFDRIKKTINLNGATSHSFRASYATMMNAHCAHVDPKVLQSALRHKTPDLAIKVYTKENSNKTKIAEEEYGRWLADHLA